MAGVEPLEAVHYNLAAIPSLADVTAPPYDVIDAAKRADLVQRSPFNVVEIDLPEGPGDADKYEYAAQTFESWLTEGILAADREPAIWPLEQDYTGPDGQRRTRRGFLCRVRLAEYDSGEIRPHERTQPGPKEDRLRLTRATRHNLSPIFSLHPGDAWESIGPRLQDSPWGEVTDDDGTTHRVWRLEDPAVAGQIRDRLADAELLIADGHHRYETALAYAREVGGDGPHQYVLMCLVSLEDPGLTVFATHRLLTGLADESERQVALGKGIRDLFETEEVPLDGIDPSGDEGTGVFGYIDAHHKQAYRLRLKEPGAAAAAMPGRSGAYQRLDAAILEELVLKGILDMTTEEIAAKKGLAYNSNAESAVAAVTSGEADCGFLLRPTPVEQVREVAAAGETMPPKSTYFFPKLLTGIAFNPLS